MRSWNWAILGAACLLSQAVAAQSCPGGLRPVNLGVPVSPPNVVHTVSYVGKALGIFTEHCIAPTIVQFDGGDSPAAVAAVSQGSVISMISEVPIARGMHAKLVWGMVPLAPQAYFVAAEVQTPADLKGKRLSAAGGGVGGFNWLMGREMLKLAGLKVEDAVFIAGGTAGRLPGLLAGQVDGVVLHPEDGFIAAQKKPGLHALKQLAEVIPNWQFNSFGAADAYVEKNPQLIRNVVTSLILSARAIYQQHDRVIPVMVEATGKPRDAVEAAYGYLTKNCIWAVNTGIDPQRVLWTEDNDIANGDVAADKRLGVDQIVATAVVHDALAGAGGPIEINGCKS